MEGRQHLSQLSSPKRATPYLQPIKLRTLPFEIQLPRSPQNGKLILHAMNRFAKPMQRLSPSQKRMSFYELYKHNQQKSHVKHKQKQPKRNFMLLSQSLKKEKQLSAISPKFQNKFLSESLEGLKEVVQSRLVSMHSVLSQNQHQQKTLIKNPQFQNALGINLISYQSQQYVVKRHKRAILFRKSVREKPRDHMGRNTLHPPSPEPIHNKSIV